MVPFQMVVSHVFRDGQSQVSLSQRNQSFKALALNRKHKSLRESVQVRTVCWQPHRFDTSLVQGSSKCLRVQWFPVDQQIPLAQQEPRFTPPGTEAPTASSGMSFSCPSGCHPMALTHLELGRAEKNRSISRRLHRIQFRHRTRTLEAKPAEAERRRRELGLGGRAWR